VLGTNITYNSNALLKCWEQIGGVYVDEGEQSTNLWTNLISKLLFSTVLKVYGHELKLNIKIVILHGFKSIWPWIIYTLM